MQISQNSVWRKTFNFGALVGGLFIVASLVFYMKGQPISLNQKLTSVNYFLAMTGVFFGVKHYRDSVLGGRISFGRALGAGVVILFIASVFYAFYTYILISFFDRDILKEFITIVQDNYMKAGLEGDTLDQIMSYYKRVTPGILAFNEIFAKTFMGFIFSLILAGFLKRNQNLFNSRQMDKFEGENNQ